MGRGADARQVAQQAHILRFVAEFIVANDTAHRFAAEHRIFVGINLLEDRRLVPHLAFVIFQNVSQFVLLDIQNADLQLGIGLGIVDQIMQPAPASLDLADLFVMQDLVHLRGQHLVDTRDQRFDRLDRIARNRRRARAFLGGNRQVRDQRLQLFAVAVLDPEILFQQIAEFGQINGFGFGGATGGGLLFFGHAQPSSPDFAAAMACSAACCSRGSLFSNCAMRFSASTLPSI